ncbi:2-dehydro-3-deoxyglucarate aldolase [Candidatus Burkholderia humilis]|nr:2-dehydro-3-deoxyglucarate aldolase [Candidatus Burkholderia humilis]
MPSSTPFQPLPNRFKAALERQQQIGTWSSRASPIVTELLGIVGFDWILIDTEHAPTDPISLILQLMSLKDGVSAPVVRPPANEQVAIKRLLDVGVVNFLIPFVDTAADAERAVTATHYPPQGVRGVSVGHRGNKFGMVSNYFDVANDNMCVAVQIESRASVENINVIAAVPGVDALFVRPSDLAANYDYLGDPNHPDVQAAIKHVFERVHAAGKASGILAPAQTDAERYLGWGASMVAVCADLGMLRQAAQASKKHFMQE